MNVCKMNILLNSATHIRINSIELCTISMLYILNPLHIGTRF